MAFRKLWVVLLSCGTAMLSGCALWHDLQPHRLHRWNRVAPPHLDPEFSQVVPRSIEEPLILRAQNVDLPGGVDSER